MKQPVPREISERIPLMKKEWLPLYNRMGEHSHAPRWNTMCGDRLFKGDLEYVRGFAAGLESERTFTGPEPSESIIEWCESMKNRSHWFESKIAGLDLKREWHLVPLMRRSDMQSSLEYILPYDANLSRLVVNPTSGTTGHPIPAPNHPAAVGCYDPMIQYALRMNGLKSSCVGDKVAAIQVCSQQKTIVYHTVHSYLDGAGFAKINLNENEWRSPESSALYIKDMAPVFLSGDPYSFLDYIRRGIEYRPGAILSTAVTLERALREKISGYFRCPVVDMYSLNETGPVAYSCPDDPSKYHILPHDIYVEAVSETGEPLPEGEVGKIAVSGGRNPYLPLLRYLTGDRGAVSYGKCSCGETSPTLSSFEGRELVLFRSRGGGIVNSIDISGIVRSFPVYSFSFLQRADYSCILKIDAGGEMTASLANRMKDGIEALFGEGVTVEPVREKPAAGGKFRPFICEVE